jgi:hypothetical protein
MGLDLVVNFSGPAPRCERVVGLLSARGLTMQLRMIDGMPAFPDETPPATQPVTYR